MSLSLECRKGRQKVARAQMKPSYAAFPVSERLRGATWRAKRLRHAARRPGGGVTAANVTRRLSTRDEKRDLNRQECEAYNKEAVRKQMG